MSGISLRQVSAFLAVAECRSFTVAAERMNIAQPALSQAVRELEAELGLRLLDRTTRRVELTVAGQEFREATSRVMGDLNTAIRNARDLADRKRGRMTIAAPPLLAAHVIPLAICDFAISYPDIEVAVHDVSTTSIVETVRNGHADCGLGTFSANEEGLSRIRLVRDRLQLFCRHDSVFAQAGAVRWSDLADQPLLALTQESAIRRIMESGLEAADIPSKPIHEVHQIATVLGMIAAGLGIAVLPTYARSGVHGATVVTRPLTEPIIERDIVLIHASGRSVSPAVAAFTPILRNVIQRLTPEASPKLG